MKQFIFVVFALVSFNVFGKNITIEQLDNSAIWNKTEKNGVAYYIKKDSRRVPILCFHKLNDELRYGISSKNFEDFLVYLNDNKFFLVTDRNFLDKDFSDVPTGYTPIIMGSDDASEGNFLYDTIGSSETGELDQSSGEPSISKDTMVSLLEKHINSVNGKINFTFYVAFKGMPFRQTGGETGEGENYRGYDILGKKFNYLLDNFYLGIHTITHPVTKNTAAEDFKWELDEFFSVMETYVGDRISLINTLAYPHGCAILKPDMEKMLRSYDYKGVKIKGGFDFDGYFSQSPYSISINDMDVSRLGVDNKNIERVYGFLQNIPLFKSERVIVVSDEQMLKNVSYSEEDTIMVVK